MPLTTTIKSIQDIMRKDVGVDGDAQRIGQLFSPAFLTSFLLRRHEATNLRRCACSECSTYCQVRLRAQSGARLASPYPRTASRRNLMRSAGCGCSS
jgi:hypothetical protein